MELTKQEKLMLDADYAKKNMPLIKKHIDEKVHEFNEKIELFKKSQEINQKLDEIVNIFNMMVEENQKLFPAAKESPINLAIFCESAEGFHKLMYEIGKRMEIDAKILVKNFNEYKMTMKTTKQYIAKM